MSLNDDRRCTECGSLEHRFCGRCSRCKENAVFNVAEGDDQLTGEVLSECCSARPSSDWAEPYDDAQENYRRENLPRKGEP